MPLSGDPPVAPGIIVPVHTPDAPAAPGMVAAAWTPGTPDAPDPVVPDYNATTPDAPDQVVPDWFPSPNGPPVATGLPTISGTLQAGNTLTAVSAGWNNGPVTSAYTWKIYVGSSPPTLVATLTGPSITAQAGSVHLTERATNSLGYADANATPVSVSGDSES